MMKKKDIVLELSIVLGILLIGTLVFRFSDLDLLIQNFFYSETEGWYLANTPLFSMLYNYITIPIKFIAILAILTLVAGLKWRKFFIYRKISLFIILSLIIGPILIVNIGFKAHWDRPRPRHIENFGGSEEFVKVWNMGESGNGASFPSGHAAGGYYFLVFYFILRKKSKFLSLTALTLSLSYGTLVGVSRIAQGGHFASDVLWSAGFIYITCLILYHLLNIETVQDNHSIPEKI